MRDYTQMNELQRRLGPRGLVVLGFPCNQFGHQVRGAGRGGLGRRCRRVGSEALLSPPAASGPLPLPPAPVPAGIRVRRGLC